MWNFLKEKFFFLIDKEEKEYIRQKVMKRDHAVLQIIICIIALFEAVVLVLSILFPNSNEPKAITDASRIIYSILISSCIICFIGLAVYRKKEKPFPYYVFVSIFTFILMMWGVGISLIVSFDSFTLLYYVLTIIAASALICLEPWVETLCALLSTVIYVILYYSLDGIQKTSDVTFISGVFLALLIALVCFYFNFYRRIRAISLELKVTKLNAILQDKAHTDQLTGVNNRLFLSEKLGTEEQDDFVNGGVLMLDLDFFKKINDTYGHLAGDQCLAEAGRIILEATKDIEGFSVRYGGEEFLIYIKTTTKDELFAFAESIRKTIENNKIQVLKSKKISYTVSIGLSLGKNKNTFADMIDASDKALYKAKETRNTTKFLD